MLSDYSTIKKFLA